MSDYSQSQQIFQHAYLLGVFFWKVAFVPLSLPGMSETFLMVDYENVREIALSQVPDAWMVKIFIGKSQNSIPFTLANDAQRLGERLEWMKIEGDGRNNLDFHVAYYLGALSQEHPSSAFVVLSKDKGFDALLRHLSQRGINCCRVENLCAAPSPSQDGEDPHFSRALEILQGTQKKLRPRKRKTLISHISAIFQKKLTNDEVQKILELFLSKRLISEANNCVTYNF